MQQLNMLYVRSTNRVDVKKQLEYYAVFKYNFHYETIAKLHHIIATHGMLYTLSNDSLDNKGLFQEFATCTNGVSASYVLSCLMKLSKSSIVALCVLNLLQQFFKLEQGSRQLTFTVDTL